MDPISTSIEAISAQTQARVRSEIGIKVFREALNAESSAALQLIQMMNQSAGLGTSIDTQV